MPDNSFSWRHWWERSQERLRTWRVLPSVYLRLLADLRVPARARLWPLLGLLYLLLPLDADWLAAIGWLDDLVVLWFGLYLFRLSCPSSVVQEHLRALQEPSRRSSPLQEGEHEEP